MAQFLVKKIMHKIPFELNFYKNFYFAANGMPFTIEVIQAVASMASADGFSLIYTQTSCSLSP